MNNGKDEFGKNCKEMKLSDEELENVNGAERLNLSILHPIDSWGKVFGKLFEPYAKTLDTLAEKSKRNK
ncbi:MULTISPECIES: hypothetical protein [unclassified Bradyrhizobium]